LRNAAKPRRQPAKPEWRGQRARGVKQELVVGGQRLWLNDHLEDLSAQDIEAIIERFFPFRRSRMW